METTSVPDLEQQKRGTLQHAPQNARGEPVLAPIGLLLLVVDDFEVGILDFERIMFVRDLLCRIAAEIFVNHLDVSLATGE